MENKVTGFDEFSVNTQISRASYMKEDIILHIDANFLVEEDAKDSKILSKYELASILWIKVRREPKNENTVKFYLSCHKAVKYSLNSIELGYFLCNLVFAGLTKEESEFIPLILLHPVNIAAKTIATATEIDPVYESSLAKEITDLCTAGDLMSPQLDKLILETAINANFHGQVYDPKFVSALFKLLQDYSQVLHSLETDELVFNAYQICLSSTVAESIEGNSQIPLDRGKNL